MNSNSTSGQPPVRGSGRGAIIRQMQELAAARLVAQTADSNPASNSVASLAGRGSGRGRLLEMVAEQKILKAATVLTKNTLVR